METYTDKLKQDMFEDEWKSIQDYKEKVEKENGNSIS